MNKRITPYSRIKVFWNDKPSNYSFELEKRVQAQFANKCGVPVNRVKVVFKAVKVNDSGETIDFANSGVDNIMDINYQRELQTKWLEINDVHGDEDMLVKLDNRVNNSLDPRSLEVMNRRWSIVEIKINNFLCFGEGNKVSFKNLKGISVVNSLPENQGGKTTFSIDAPKYLLYGKTTKTDKNEEIFNTFSNNDELLVEGIIKIESDNYVIKRKMVRTAKRSGDGYTIKNSVKYFRILPDNTLQELDGEDAKETTDIITKAIGSESDFDITTLATMDNLESLITTKPTENGKLLNRFIGLEIIDDKLKTAREMYNEFNKKKLGNIYNTVTLNEEIEEYKDKIVTLNELQGSHTKKLEEVSSELTELNNEKDSLLSQKFAVDDELANLNTNTINDAISKIAETGKSLKGEKKELDNKIAAIEVVEFDESAHFQLTKKKNETTYENTSLTSDNEKHLKTISDLENAQVCPTCHRDLDDVDNTDEIKRLEGVIAENLETISSNKEYLVEIEGELSKISEAQAKMDERDRLVLKFDKVNIELDGLANKYRELNTKLQNYEKNKATIDKNKALEKEITNVKAKIQVSETSKSNILDNLSDIKIELSEAQKGIETNERHIEKILVEEDVERVYKIYIDMYGKKGIGKMVLRSVLPIINSELRRLMDDVCDFYVQLDINHKNDVEYQIVKDGVIKSLKSGSGLEKTISSIAIRAILGKMAYLPLPNFITFDEVFGKIAEENLEKMRSLFDKIRELYDMVFIITHNKLVKDWADNIITIKKTENISELKVL